MWGIIAIGVVLAGLPAGCGSSSGSQSGPNGVLTPGTGAGGGSGNPAPSTLITVSSLGGIRLGETKTQVEAALGSGSPVPPSGGLAVVRYPGAAMLVTYQHGRVFSIHTVDARYRTSQEVGVGSDMRAVKKLSNASCIGLGNGAFDCKVDDSGGSGDPPLIDFQGDGGKVRAVDVQSVNE